MGMDASVPSRTDDPLLIDVGDVVPVCISVVLREAEIYEVQHRDVLVTDHEILRLDVSMNEVL